LTRGLHSPNVASVNRVLRAFRLLIVLSLLLLLLSGCSLFQPRVITLCTNRPEMAAYVEHFNTLSADYRVILCYKLNPAESVMGRSRDADLILGPWLNGSAARRYFESLDTLFNREYLKREDFYSGLLNAGMWEGKQELLPFSFNMPAIVFPADALAADVPTLVAPMEYVKQKGAAFNQSVRDRLVRMGFSPLWQPEFLYNAAEIFGTQFRETPEGSVHWNSARLQDMKEFCAAWITETNLGYEQDNQFQRTYLYEPMPKLLDSGRILFYLTDSSSLFRNLEDQLEEVDFRWLGAENRIPAGEEVLYFGIPKGSRNRRGARLFLTWVFQPETQARLLEINQEKRLDTFGIAGGFSSLRIVNEREFPGVYKQLLGRIPPEQMLVFSKALPVNWGEQKERIVIPWLVSYVTGKADEELLSQRLMEFRSP
jgi:ABC-type glycerol-3-phosphate transport system substrate-binding protein